MTIQQAAARILKEHGAPMKSRDIARIALERGWVTSTAKDPIQSLAATIDKNVRDGTYNSPRLVFVSTPSRRQVGLPGQDVDSANTAQRKSVTINLPRQLADQLDLAARAGLAESFDETVALVVRKGLKGLGADIRSGLLAKLEGLTA